jgi:hypothetical protein
VRQGLEGEAAIEDSPSSQLRFYTSPDATSDFAGVSDPPAGSIVTASFEGPDELTYVNATARGDGPITPIDTGEPLTMLQSWYVSDVGRAGMFE